MVRESSPEPSWIACRAAAWEAARLTAQPPAPRINASTPVSSPAWKAWEPARDSESTPAPPSMTSFWADRLEKT